MLCFTIFLVFSNCTQRLQKRRSRFLAAMDDSAFVSIRFPYFSYWDGVFTENK
jgi:hypothetical protein